MLFMYLSNYHQNLTASIHPIRQVTRFKQPPDLIIFPFTEKDLQSKSRQKKKGWWKKCDKRREGKWQKDKVLKEENCPDFWKLVLWSSLGCCYKVSIINCSLTNDLKYTKIKAWQWSLRKSRFGFVVKRL